MPAALAFGGERDDGSIYDNNESWNGSAWTEVNDLNTAKNAMGGFGTSTNAVAAGGIASPGVTAGVLTYGVVHLGLQVMI